VDNGTETLMQQFLFTGLEFGSEGARSEKSPPGNRKSGMFQNLKDEIPFNH
jgi:hypothetical protein